MKNATNPNQFKSNKLYNEQSKQIVINGEEYPYFITDAGRVYSAKSGRILKNNTINNGYQTVTLCNSKTKKQMYIHRLVLMMFTEFDENLTVNHKDGKKDNNYLFNLEQATLSEQQLHSIKLKLRKRLSTKKIKITLLDIDNNILFFNSIKDASRYLNCSDVAIHNYIRGFQKTIKNHTIYAN